MQETAVRADAPPETPHVAAPRATTKARLWNLAVIVLPSAGIALLGWRHRALSDDGLIFLRTVRQVLAGNGPVLNVGERTEANTSTLWQWALVIAGWLSPADLGFTAVVGGLALTTLGVAVALDATRRLYGGAGLRGASGRYVLPAGVLVLFAVPPFWDFATTGLDTGLGTFWLAGCWWLLVRSRTLHRPGGSAARHRGDRRTQWLLGTSAWLGLGPMVRPDMAVVSLAFFVALTVVTRPGWEITVLRLTAAGALPLAYEFFRAGYYGVLTPLPGIAKEASAGDPDRGLSYVVDFVTPYWLYAPLGFGLLVLAVLLVRLTRESSAGAGGADPRGDLVVPLTPPTAALLLAGYVIWFGGDFMHARMLLPPMFLLLMPYLVIPAHRKLAPVMVAFAAYAVAVTGPWHPAAYAPDVSDDTVLIRAHDIELTGVQNADHAADWTQNFETLPVAVREALNAPEPVLLFFTPDQKTAYTMPLADALRQQHFKLSAQGGYLGLMGYLVPLDQRIVERWGFANTVAAHMADVEDWRDRLPGHRKDLGYTWMVALEAAPGAPLPPWQHPELDPARIDAARRALGCGDLKELLDSTREPMTLKRFWKNLVGAPQRTWLEIPRDPFAAERKFCGTP
jgi:arabinofuranosyltransferase